MINFAVHSKCSVNNGLCSTFCFPLPNNQRSCGCPDDVTLLEDHRTCSGGKSTIQAWIKVGVACLFSRFTLMLSMNYRVIIISTASNTRVMLFFSFCFEIVFFQKNVLVQKCSMVIQHGKFSDDCSGYLNSTCDFKCYTGFEPTLSGKLTCDENFNWIQGKSININNLCKYENPLFQVT